MRIGVRGSRIRGDAIGETLVVARKVALLRCCKPLCLVYLAAHLQTLRKACLLASLLKTGDDVARLTLVSFITNTRSVAAKPMIVAVVELSAVASPERAIITAPSRLASTRMLFDVAISVSVAVIGAVRL